MQGPVKPLCGRHNRHCRGDKLRAAPDPQRRVGEPPRRLTLPCAHQTWDALRLGAVANVRSWAGCLNRGVAARTTVVPPCPRRGRRGGDHRRPGRHFRRLQQSHPPRNRSRGGASRLGEGAPRAAGLHAGAQGLRQSASLQAQRIRRAAAYSCRAASAYTSGTAPCCAAPFEPLRRPKQLHRSRSSLQEPSPAV